MDPADEPYLALIDRLGRRSTGDNLLGFRIDLDVFLGRAGSFGEVKTQTIDLAEIDRVGAMLITRARSRRGRDRAAMRAAILDCWMSTLVYRGNQRHRFEEVGDDLHFHYATWTPDLGVVGRVECEVVARK